MLQDFVPAIRRFPEPENRRHDKHRDRGIQEQYDKFRLLQIFGPCRELRIPVCRRSRRMERHRGFGNLYRRQGQEEEAGRGTVEDACHRGHIRNDCGYGDDDTVRDELGDWERLLPKPSIKE